MRFRIMKFVTVLLPLLFLCHQTPAANAQQRAPWTASRLQGTPTPPEPFRIVPAFPKLKFDHPTGLRQIPGTNRLLLTEIGGRVFTFPTDSATTTADLAGDLSVVAAGNVSVFSAALHPQFERNRFVYVC